jgi:gluconolactonase
VLAPSGDVLGIIETPEVSGSLVWGGEDLRSLFVCTSTTMRVIQTKVGPAPIPFSVPTA